MKKEASYWWDCPGKREMKFENCHWKNKKGKIWTPLFIIKFPER